MARRAHLKRCQYRSGLLLHFLTMIEANGHPSHPWWIWLRKFPGSVWKTPRNSKKNGHSCEQHAQQVGFHSDGSLWITWRMLTARRRSLTSKTELLATKMRKMVVSVRCGGRQPALLPLVVVRASSRHPHLHIYLAPPLCCCRCCCRWRTKRAN